MNITVPLQIVLVQRWVRDNQITRDYFKVWSKYSGALVDYIMEDNELIKMLSSKGSVK